MTPTQPSQAVEAAVLEIEVALLKLSAETHKSVDDAIHALQKLECVYPTTAQWWSIVSMALYKAYLLGRAELARPQAKPSNSEAADARREIGKWLNEGTNKPVDREALAQLCAGFDVLARPQEVAAGGFDELIMRHGTTGVHQHWFTRTEVLAIVNDLAASRAPEAVRAEPVTQRSDKDYAIEHAEYMAIAAEQLIEKRNALDLAEYLDGETPGGAEDVVDAASEAANEALIKLRESIYEFRKRRDRAAQPKAPAPKGDTKDAARMATLAERANWIGESVGGHWVIKLHNKRHTSFLQTVDAMIKARNP